MSTSYGSTSYGSMPSVNMEHPSHGLLKDTGFVWHVYHKYHTKCLKGQSLPYFKICACQNSYTRS